MSSTPSDEQQPAQPQPAQHRNRRRFETNDLKLKIREMRTRRIPEREIMHDLEISRKRFYKLMDKIDEEDARTLGFDNPMRLHSVINIYRETLDYVINVNKGICDSKDTMPEDKQESSRIIADCALTWVKVQMEGPKVLRQVYQPIGSYVAFDGQPLPVPKSQRDKLTENSAVQEIEGGTGISIPLTNDEPPNDNIVDGS